ncbi:methyl-accepting chemotaxis protein [Methanolacinia paynteri]|uniref:methyl-accepting chemotaxis protein n=1 Tax=Methanolacinia paynteri TaxID=230356 RepID=UPI00064F6556|nr:methyl-accepting chemotaxis protein [Methanolacinia paynteri]
MSIETIQNVLENYVNGNKNAEIDTNLLGPESVRLGEMINQVIKEKNENEDQKNFFYDVVMKIPVPIAIMDPSLNIVDANDDLVEISGTSKERFCKLDLQNFYREFKIELMEGNGVKKALETKSRVEGIFHMTFKGDVKIMEAHTIPLLDEYGKIRNFNLVFIDVTESARTIDYIEAEVSNVAYDLNCIAEGRLEELRLEVGEADEYTGEVRKQFLEITSNVRLVNETLHNLVADIHKLVVAGNDGRLEFRADSSGYKGAYTGLIEGTNDLLKSVAVPVNEAMDICNHYADADFTARFSDDIKVKGDFLKFKESLNNIGINVAETLNVTNKVTGQVAANSTEVVKGTNEVAKAAEGVANTSQKTADLTKELNASIENINSQISDLSASNEEIASTSQEVFNAANHVVEIGKEAQNLGKDANKKMENVEKIASESVNEIHELTEKIKEVSNVVKLINDITSQINLLALNAAIEAARAGEHGRGFAVVAGEVKNLAAEARAATGSIESVVSAVQSSSEKTASAITSANQEIVNGVDSVTKAIEALNTIITNAGQVSNDIGEITKAIEDQAKISNNVVQSVEEGTAKTKEVQKESEELAALAEEASASVEEIGSAIQEVNALIKNLEEANSKFKY